MKQATAWLKQAQSDFKWAKLSAQAGFYAQACFVSQQVAEKSLKAIAYHRNALQVKSHSILNIAKALGINGTLEESARTLDLYYISTRYPDALPDNAVPSESFSQTQATHAIELASAFLVFAEGEVK
jgi:HEPN domain-containing protein